MKKTLITLTAVAAMSFGSLAIADEAQGPIMMTDAQLDTMVAGRAMDVFWDPTGGEEETGAYVFKPANNDKGGTNHSPGVEGDGTWILIEADACETQQGGCSIYLAGLDFPYDP
jgi:hypothetical protein